jgi:DNA-binding beta-propeller fold protein YncE
MISFFRLFRSLLLLAAVPVLLSACKKDKDDPKPANNPVYVVNQGNLNSATAAITRYNRAEGAVVRDQFRAANPDEVLGDVAQSMTVHDGKGYIVVNNSNKIVVVQMSDFKQIGEITGLLLPRYMAVYDGKGYVTETIDYNGSNGRVSEINLTTNTLTGRTFTTGKEPEEIVASAAGILVANANESFLTSITLLPTDSITTIPTGVFGPKMVRLDAGGRAWVLCAGKIVYKPFGIDTTASTAGALLSFSLSNPSATSVRVFNRKGSEPNSLSFNADRTRLYYTYNGNVFAMNTSDATLPRTAFIRRSFAALGIDPTDGTIYAADTRGYTGDGHVLRYRPTGAVIDSFATAVGPTQFVF